jgi:tetratricopeptide (TPR) repeat protein
MNMTHFLKHKALFLSFLIISFNSFSFEQKDFVNDITHAKELFSNGEHDAAIKYWESKQSTYGGQTGHYELELGTFYSRMKAFDKAEETYLAGMQLEDKYPRLNISLSYIYLWTGRLEQASALLDETIKEYPEWWLSYYTKAHHEFLTENFKAAKKLTKQSLSMSETARGYVLLARVSFGLNDTRAVISAIEEAINLEPNYLADLSAMKIYAVSLATEGLNNEAMAVIEEVKTNNAMAADDEELEKLLTELKKPQQ